MNSVKALEGICETEEAAIEYPARVTGTKRALIHPGNFSWRTDPQARHLCRGLIKETRRCGVAQTGQSLRPKFGNRVSSSVASLGASYGFIVISFAGLTKLKGDHNQRFVTSVRSQENTDHRQATIMARTR